MGALSIRLGKFLAADVVADSNAFAGMVELCGRTVAASTPVEVLLARGYRPVRRVPRPVQPPRILGEAEFLQCTAAEAAEIAARGGAAAINFLGDEG
jgi:hypothetical protein